MPTELADMPKPRRFWKMEDLAKRLGVTTRTLRNYCEEKDLIPEAKRKRGSGVWRIPLKLSPKTRHALLRRSGKRARDLHAMGFRGPVGQLVGCEHDELELLMYAAQQDATSVDEALQKAEEELIFAQPFVGDEFTTEFIGDDAALEEWHKLRSLRERLYGKTPLTIPVADAVTILRAALDVKYQGGRVSAQAVAKELGIHRHTLVRKYDAKNVKLILRAFRVCDAADPPPTDQKQSRRRTSLQSKGGRRTGLRPS
jgi:AcrR family transcriptional regulator